MAAKARALPAHQISDDLDPLLPIAQVKSALGVGTTTTYKLVKLGELAPPRQIRGTRRVGWRRSDVQAYLDGLAPVKLRQMPGGAA